MDCGMPYGGCHPSQAHAGCQLQWRWKHFGQKAVSTPWLRLCSSHRMAQQCQAPLQQRLPAPRWRAGSLRWQAGVWALLWWRL